MIFPVKKIFWGLVAIVILLMAIHTFNTLSINFLAEPLSEGFVDNFHIDREGNLPTWFSTILLSGVAGASFLILVFQSKQSGTRQAQQVFWAIFTGVFLFLSIDEGAQIHELIDELTRVKWVFIYAPITAVFFAYCVTMLWGKKLVPSSIAQWIIGGLVLFAVGGLLMEWVSYRFALPYALRQARYVLEEGGEMMGVIIVLRGCLMEANRRFLQVLGPAKEH